MEPGQPSGLEALVAAGGATAAVRAVGLLGGMLTYAKEVGYIEHNPARGIRKPADKRRSFRLALKGYRDLGRALEDAERKGEHWQAVAGIQLLAVTGCRRAEIVNLKWSRSISRIPACDSVIRKPAFPFDLCRNLRSDLGQPRPHRRIRIAGPKSN
jgi:hypothetical protein